MPNQTSVSLLYRVRNQEDRQSWNEFAELYYGLVHSWLRRQGVQDPDADDVVQEVMTYVCGEIGNFEHNGPDRSLPELASPGDGQPTQGALETPAANRGRRAQIWGSWLTS